MAVKTYAPEDYFSPWDADQKHRGAYNPYQAINAYQTYVVDGSGGGGGVLGPVYALQRRQYVDPSRALGEKGLNKLLAGIEERGFSARVEPRGDQSVQLFINGQPVFGAFKLKSELYAAIGGDLETIRVAETAPSVVAFATPAEPVAALAPPHVAAVIVGGSAPVLSGVVQRDVIAIGSLLSRAKQSGNVEAARLVEDFLSRNQPSFADGNGKINDREEIAGMMRLSQNNLTEAGKAENNRLADQLDAVLPPAATPNAVKKPVTAAKG